MSNQVLGGSLLVAGTAIGAGMLALPISAGVHGYWGSISLLFGCFIFMMATLFIFLEASLYSKDRDINVIGLSRMHLGRWAEITSWTCFLLLLYAACTAYLVAGGGKVKDFLLPSYDLHAPPSSCLQIVTYLIVLLAVTVQALPFFQKDNQPNFFAFTLYLFSMIGLMLLIPAFSNVDLCAILFFIVFTYLLLNGMHLIDIANRWLMLGLIVSFIFLIKQTAPVIHTSNLTGSIFNGAWQTIPVIALAFTSHIILPSMRSFAQDNTKKIIRILLIGSAIPLVIYFIWQTIILGVVSTEQIQKIGQMSGDDKIDALTHALDQGHSIAYLFDSFSFFAIVTSFIGASISLKDFLKDGLKNALGYTPNNVWVSVLTFVPPLIMGLLYKNFTNILELGGIMILILYGILPTLMVQKARKNYPTPAYRMFGGFPMLVIVALISASIIGIVAYDVASLAIAKTPQENTLATIEAPS